MHQILRRVADARVVIPLRPDVWPLNLSVSAGICLFETLRETGAREWGRAPGEYPSLTSALDVA